MSGTVTAARFTDISREDLVTRKGLPGAQSEVTQLALIGIHLMEASSSGGPLGLIKSDVVTTLNNNNDNNQRQQTAVIASLFFNL